MTELSEDSKNRFEANPLRILDSKDPKDQELCLNAPSILDYLSTESQQYFADVKHCLEKVNIPYEVNSSLVRGLDYYNQTVFEVVSQDLGAQNSIGGGGRYDGLIKTMGGPDLPSVGFGTGIERVIQTMLRQEVPLPKLAGPQLFIIPLGESARAPCFELLGKLRRDLISAQMDFTGKKVGKVMSYASDIQAKYVVVIGDNELATGEVELKEMSTGNKELVPIAELTARLLEKYGC